MFVFFMFNFVFFHYYYNKVEGFLSEDAVEMAGLHIKGVTFAEINNMPIPPISNITSGLLGLAYLSLARDQVAPLFDYIVKQRLVQSYSFGMFLSVDEHGTRQGQLTLGGVDPQFVNSTFTYTPVKEV
jgi:cathepsin D